jgi:hypothetical protein
MKKITPEQAAKMLGQSKTTIRAALQQGTSPFGYACKGKGDRWFYHISPKKLMEYAGVDEGPFCQAARTIRHPSAATPETTREPDGNPAERLVSQA